MRTINLDELMEINAASKSDIVFPIVVGFVVGGAPGALFAASTLVAKTGLSNLEHLITHHEIPTFKQMID